MHQDVPTACWSCLICSGNSKHNMLFSVCGASNFGCCAAIWGAPSWGHVVSSDLAHWQRLPNALEPDTSYDRNGVFSGSATVVNGTPILLYTGEYHCCIFLFQAAALSSVCCAHQAYAYHLYIQLLDCSPHAVVLHDAPPDTAMRYRQIKACCS